MVERVFDSIRSSADALDGHIRDVLFRGSAALLLRVMGAGLSFAVNVIIARLLGAEGAGVYFLSLTVASIGGMIGRMGLNNTLMRFVAERASQKEWRAVQTTYRRGLTIAVVASVAVAIVLSAGAGIIASRVFAVPELEAPLRIMAWGIPVLALVSLHTDLLKGIDEVERAMLLRGFGVPLLAAPLLLIVAGPYGVQGAVLVYVGASVVVAAVGGYFWYSCTPDVGVDWGRDPEVHVTYRDLLRSSLPLLVVASMGKVIRWTDTILLGIWESARVVGVYEVAFKTSMLTTFILMAANSVAAPRFASLHAQGDKEGLEKLLQQVTLLVSLLTLPIAFVFIVFPQHVLGVFGAEFNVGAGALIILVLGQFIGVATGGVISVLVMTGNEKTARNVTTLGAASNFVLNVVLVPAYGMYGAAVGTALSTAIMNVMALYAVYNSLSITSIPLRILRNREQWN